MIDEQIAWEFRGAGAERLSVPIRVSQTDAEEDVYRELIRLRFDPPGYGGDLAPLAAAEAVRQGLEQAVRVAALRSEEMAPGRKQRQEKLGLVIDTSGSMRSWSLEEVLGQVRALAHELKVGLIQWQVDAAVHGPIVYERAEEMPTFLMTIGGGGTVMQPAAEAVARVRPPLTLWVTDGWWLDEPNLPEGRHVAILTGLRCRAPWRVRFDEVVWTDEYRQQMMRRKPWH